LKKKVINKTLKKKFDAWVESIEDNHVQALVKHNTIITGGAIASMLLGEPVNDYDLYFTDKETTLAVAEYYVAKFNEAHGKVTNRIGFKTKAFVLDGALDIDKQIKEKSDENYNWASRMINNLDSDRIKIIIRSDGIAGLKEVDELLEDADEIPGEELDNTVKEKYQPVFMSGNAITLSGKIQLIIRFYGDADKIHENFDYIHCTNYWLSSTNDVYTNSAALEALLARELVYSGSKYPLCSIIRIRKFIKRGWRINAGQILKMSYQLSNLDLTDIDVLEDQLIGVDTVYFMNLIDKLRETMHNRKEAGDPMIDMDTYITSVIDKIFG